MNNAFDQEKQKKDKVIFIKAGMLFPEPELMVTELDFFGQSEL